MRTVRGVYTGRQVLRTVRRRQDFWPTTLEVFPKKGQDTNTRRPHTHSAYRFWLDLDADTIGWVGCGEQGGYLLMYHISF